MGVDVPFYYFDNYEETIDAFKDYILHQDSQYCQLATTYGKSLESFSIEIDSSLVSIWKHVAMWHQDCFTTFLYAPKDFQQAFTQI